MQELALEFKRTIKKMNASRNKRVYPASGGKTNITQAGGSASQKVFARSSVTDCAIKGN